jgi:hypothetical protein
MQVLKGVKVAFVHRQLFVKINLADEIAVIAADNIRIVFGHSKNHIWGRNLIVRLFFSKCTKAVYLGNADIWPIVPER